MKALVTALLLGVILLLDACAEIDVKSGYRLGSHSEKGILAVGITANDEMPEFYWHFRKVGTTDQKDLTFYTVQNPLMWTNPRGRLAIIELEEGDYEFFDWEVLMDVAPTEFFRIPFSVKAGRVTYLGRINLEANKQAMRFKIDSTNSAYAEDYSILQEKIPALSPAVVDQQQAVLMPCVDSSCVVTKRASDSRSIIIPIIVRIR